MKNIKHYTEEQLQRVSDMWSVRSKELQWKANKLKTRLEKRLAREAKRHASLASTRERLSNYQVIMQALLPLGETLALELVKDQIAQCEAKIQDVMYRYRLLFPEEIALKQMAVELAEMKAHMAADALKEVELELVSRVEAVEAVKEEVVVAKSSAVSKALRVANSKKIDLELGILKTLRQAPNALARLRSYRKSETNVNFLRIKTGFERMSGVFGLARLKMAG